MKGIIYQIQGIEKHPELVLEFYNIHESTKSNDERFTTELAAMTSPDSVVKIEGELAQYLTILYTDYMNAQRLTDPHDRQYIKRLMNEMKMVDSCNHLEAYYKTRNTNQYLRVLLLHLRIM